MFVLARVCVSKPLGLLLVLKVVTKELCRDKGQGGLLFSLWDMSSTTESQ